MTITEQQIFGYMRSHNNSDVSLKEILTDCSSTATGVNINHYKLQVLKPAVISLKNKGVLKSYDRGDGTYYSLHKDWMDINN